MIPEICYQFAHINLAASLVTTLIWTSNKLHIRLLQSHFSVSRQTCTQNMF